MENLVCCNKRHFLKKFLIGSVFWILKYLCIFWSLCTASGHSEAAAVSSGVDKGSPHLQQQRHQILVLGITPVWLCVQEHNCLHKVPLQPVQHFFSCRISFPVCFMTLPYKECVGSGGWGELWNSISEFLAFAEAVGYLLQSVWWGPLKHPSL